MCSVEEVLEYYNKNKTKGVAGVPNVYKKEAIVKGQKLGRQRATQSSEKGVRVHRGRLGKKKRHRGSQRVTG